MNASELFSNGGGKWRRIELTTSGTFTPSAGLLAAGGRVLAEMVGGGGGGQSGSAGSPGRGGRGGQRRTVQVIVTGSTAAVIGAGGAANTQGGSTSFGSEVAIGGLSGAVSASAAQGMSPGGAAGYDMSQATARYAPGADGTPGEGGVGGGGGGGALGGSSPGAGADGGGDGNGANGAANSGGGGGGGTGGGSGGAGGYGGSGRIVLSWQEA